MVDSTVRFISNFRELNKRILRQPYPIPNIQDLLLILEKLHDAHLLNTVQKTSKMVIQTKSKKKLKHKHFSPVIFVKLVIPSGKKGRQSKTRLVKALVDSGASESILAKANADKLPVKKNKK